MTAHLDEGANCRQRHQREAAPGQLAAREPRASPVGTEGDRHQSLAHLNELGLVQQAGEQNSAIGQSATRTGDGPPTEQAPEAD
jgi:hypothetical protein